MTLWVLSLPVDYPHPSRSWRTRTRPPGVSYARLSLNAARFSHDLCIPARQLGDPAALAAPYGVLVNQIAADAQRRGTRANEIHGVHLIHTAGGNQRDVGEGPLESLD